MLFFDWLRERSREKLLETPFPSAWDAVLRKNVGYDALLDETERRTLRQMTQVFVAEKHWEGAGGLELTDEIRVTIAAQACLLILHLEHELYRRVESIIVYPSAVWAPGQAEGFFTASTDIVAAPMPILGQAFQRGPVILVWDAVQRGGRDPRDGKNIVFHEFAHKLDMLDGSADGVPPIAGRQTYARWIEVFSAAFAELKAQDDAGGPTFLDTYALTDGAEFFAVATEAFFEQGPRMAREHGDLYAVLREFYRQDPATRRRRADGS